MNVLVKNYTTKFCIKVLAVQILYFSSLFKFLSTSNLLYPYWKPNITYTLIPGCGFIGQKTLRPSFALKFFVCPNIMILVFFVQVLIHLKASIAYREHNITGYKLDTDCIFNHSMYLTAKIFATKFCIKVYICPNFMI